MDYLLYLMFRCDKRCDGCDGKFGNFVGTKHTQGTSGSTTANMTHSSTHEDWTDNVWASASFAFGNDSIFG